MNELTEHGDKRMTVREVADVLGVSPDTILDSLCVSSKYCHTPVDEFSAISLFDIILALIEDLSEANKRNKEFDSLVKRAKEAIAHNTDPNVFQTDLFTYWMNLPKEKCDISKKGFVYISTDKSGFFKIGRTKGLSQREKALRCGNLEYKTTASVLTEDNVRLETFLHNFFMEKRIEGEWFALSSEDIDILVNYFGFIKGINNE